MKHASEFQSLNQTAICEEGVPEEQVLGQYIPMLYHYNMLQDESRVGAFREAIELMVRPGMHVVELGGGTGILSSFAAKRGARVTCVERNPELVEAAGRFLALNSLDRQVKVVQADAAEFVPDSPVDFVICEMLHVGLLREKQAQVISAFKRNYARSFDGPLPVFIPEVSILMAQPVEQCFDFFGYTAPVPLFQEPILDQPRTTELGELQPYANIAYDGPIPMLFDVRQPLAASTGGKMNAIRFVTQNVLAVDVAGQRAITWPNQCLVLPLPQPQQVTRGEAIEMAFRYSCGGSVGALGRAIRCGAPSCSASAVRT